MVNVAIREATESEAKYLWFINQFEPTGLKWTLDLVPHEKNPKPATTVWIPCQQCSWLRDAGPDRYAIYDFKRFLRAIVDDDGSVFIDD